MASPCVLIIEDEEQILNSYEDYLNAAKMTPVKASDGSIGLKHIDEQRFDLVITDLRMPNLPVQDLLKHMRAESLNANTPIMVISGNISQEVIKELRKVGRIHFSNI